MDRAGIGRVCRALPAVTLEHSFGEDYDVYKVGGRMFALVNGNRGLSFKVSDVAYEVLTESGRAAPAPYLARARWVHLENPGAWPEDELAEHLAIAHGLIAAKLTKKTRAELGLG